MPERTTTLVMTLIAGLFVSEAADAHHLHTIPSAALIWFLIVYTQSVHRCRLCRFPISPENPNCPKCGSNNPSPLPASVFALVVSVLILTLIWFTDGSRLCRVFSDSCFTCSSTSLTGATHG